MRLFAGRLEGETTKEYRERLKEEYKLHLEKAMAQAPRRKEGSAVSQGVSAKGRSGIPPVQPGKYHPADIKRTREVLCAIPVAKTAEELRHKEIVYLFRRRKAMRTVVTLIWDSTEQSLRRIASSRGWGEPPEALLKLLSEKAPPPKSSAEVRSLWPAPFKLLEEIWDETYLREFAEVTETFHWGQDTWTTFLTPWARDFLGNPSPFVARNTGWAPIRLYVRELQCQGNRAKEVDEAIRMLGIDEEGKASAPPPQEGKREKRMPQPGLAGSGAVPVVEETLERPPMTAPTTTQYVVSDPALAVLFRDKAMEVASATTLQKVFQEGGGARMMQTALDGVELAEPMARRHVRETEGFVRDLEYMLVQMKAKLLRARDDLNSAEYAVHATRAARDVWERGPGHQPSLLRWMYRVVNCTTITAQAVKCLRACAVLRSACVTGLGLKVIGLRSEVKSLITILELI